MQSVLIVIHLFVVAAMIGVVLLQKSEGGGLGIGGGGGGGFLSSRGTANVLTRATAFLAITFFATSLLLSILAGMDRKPRSILQSGQPAPAGQGGLLDTLRGGEPPPPAAPGAPAAPAAPAAPPAGPQVPRPQ